MLCVLLHAARRLPAWLIFDDRRKKHEHSSTSFRHLSWHRAPHDGRRSCTPGKEKRTKGLEALGTGDGLDAGLMIFVALLWPIWILSILGRKEPPAKP